jgi:hypothetical protein
MPKLLICQGINYVHAAAGKNTKRHKLNMTKHRKFPNIYNAKA